MKVLGLALVAVVAVMAFMGEAAYAAKKAQISGKKLLTNEISESKFIGRFARGRRGI
jgi:hypothetical protein